MSLNNVAVVTGVELMAPNLNCNRTQYDANATFIPPSTESVDERKTYVILFC